MTLCEMIYRRRSCRSFLDSPVNAQMLEMIKNFSMKPLYPEIKIRWEIVSKKQVKCICPWTTPQLIAVYSEEADGWLENVGFMFQQMDLYLQSLGLGVCWLGMGKMNPKTASGVEGMRFAIMLAFGNPKGDQQRHDINEFKRKAPEQIADQADPKLEPARLAPSAINSQPWYFVHEGNDIHTYCIKNGVPGYMNFIDVGIALAHLYVANKDTFRFTKPLQYPECSGYHYIGRVTL